MSRFYADERLEIGVFTDPTTGKKSWATSSAMHFLLGHEATAWLFTVPMGFVTDLGSIPWWMRWLFTGHEATATRAYILHDYVNGLTNRRPPGPDVLSSQLAAAVLYEALALDGEPLWSRRVQYLGVVLGIAKQEW